MLIQNLEQKTRLALTTVAITVVGCVLLCCFTVWSCLTMVTNERSQVYVLDGDIPFIAERAKIEENFALEAKAHIASFHQMFFTLTPDDDYIRWTLGKAMYLADESALKQKKTLEESGFYNELISSTGVASLIPDSISFDESTGQFRYYGTQIIKRRTRTQRRSLITTGYIDVTERSANNPHGLIIKNWRTIENTDKTE